MCTCNALGVEYPRIGWRAESEMAAVLRKKNQTASLSGKVLQIWLVKEPEEDENAKDEHLDVKIRHRSIARERRAGEMEPT